MRKKYDWHRVIFNKKIWLALFLGTYLLAWLRLPEEIPLYYSQALRSDRLASKYELLIIPAAVYIFFIIAEQFLYKLALHNKTMTGLIRVFVLALTVLSYIIFLKIILLVV